MKKGIAIAGNLIVDYVKIVDSYPQKGMLSNIKAVSRCIGGCAANTIVDLAKIDSGVPLMCIGAVGADENGQYILDTLAKHNIDVSMVKKDALRDTSFTDVMTLENTGERTFFHARGANAAFSYSDIDFGKINAAFFHIGYALLLDGFDAEDSEYGTVMARTLAAAKEQGLRTSMDVVSENSTRFKKIVTPSLKYCDYIVINEIEAAMITGIPARNDGRHIIERNMKDMCEKLLECGVSETAVIHAPEAGWALNSAGAYCVVPSLKLPKGYIKGTVGAGDAFCAGFLYGMYAGRSVKNAIEIAHAAAALNLAHTNSIDGMKNISVIERVLSNQSVDLTQD